MLYAAPGATGAKHAYKAHYDNFIGGEWMSRPRASTSTSSRPSAARSTPRWRARPPKTSSSRSTPHAAAEKWGKTPAAERANLLLKIADRIEANPKLLAYVETVDNGKPIPRAQRRHPARHRSLPLFRGLRARPGRRHQRDRREHGRVPRPEPLGVVGQIIPSNFPILMATWKLAPALGAGNCVVLKPAESTPIGVLIPWT